ncbi:MAG: ATP-dependent Clp protease ATP-binding subunit ClpC [Solirubrobacteraceae bacterium]|jgi:hypothetical protein|nr:ATP-dependent Clp protease ATP-binding subunit ClpC [Solirubrobacteraceae bacterium]
MADDLAPLSELCRRSGGGNGPADALHAITALRARLDELERRNVSAMLSQSATWADIARPLGITRQAAHHRHRNTVRATGPAVPASAEVQRVLVTSAARGTVRLARAEARALGSSAVGTEHLLLALTQTAPEPVAHVLAEAGIDEHALRSTLRPTIVDDGHLQSTEGGFTAHAREVLEGSLREAVERGEGFIAADHLLLALLRNPSGGAAQTLDALAVKPQAIFATLASQCR